jgi:hypothetical protein
LRREGGKRRRRRGRGGGSIVSNLKSTTEECVKSERHRYRLVLSHTWGKQLSSNSHYSTDSWQFAVKN